MSPEVLEQHRAAVRRVIEAMNARLGRSFRLDEMAEVAIMSPFHLVRVFREMTGLPPRRFLTALRLQAAKRLLVASDQSVTDISLDVGYNSLGTFSRRFTEMVGMSPLGFRRFARRGLQTGPPFGWRPDPAPWPRLADRGLEAELVGAAADGARVFAGLFDAAMPQGAPTACAVLSGPGRFCFPPVPDGVYHLLAVGVPATGGVAGALLSEGAPRGSAQGRRIRVRDGRTSVAVPRIHLRQAEVFDPPILTAFPPLLERRMLEQGTIAAGGRR